MKKYFQYILLLFLLFSFKNVYATELYVCSSDCTYQTLDQALYDVERYEQNQASIYLDPGNYSISRDYEFNVSISISGSSGRYTINGNDHTITYSIPISFGAEYLTIKNMNFVYNYISNAPPIGLWCVSNNLVLDGVHVTTTNSRLASSGESSGIIISSPYIQISNSSVSNFTGGIYLISGISGGVLQPRISENYISNPFNDIGSVPYSFSSIEIDSCDLSDNAFSIYGMMNGEISNTKLSSVYLDGLSTGTALIPDNGTRQVSGGSSQPYLNLLDSNDYGEAKIIRITDFVFDEDNSFTREFVDNSLSKKNLYVISGPNATIDLTVKKKDTINIQNLKKTNLLDYFVNIDEINIRSFTFTVSDPSIAVVEDGEVVFLKAGEVDVVATNQNTGEVYTVHFKLENPKTSSNPKTINSLYIMFGLLILMFVITSSMFMKKRNF